MRRYQKPCETVTYCDVNVSLDLNYYTSEQHLECMFAENMSVKYSKIVMICDKINCIP